MPITVQKTETWAFGRLYLDFVDRDAPRGELVYVMRDADGTALRSADGALKGEQTFKAGPDLIAPIAQAAVMQGATVGQNVVLACDALVHAQGWIAGDLVVPGVNPDAGAGDRQQPATEPSEPAEETESQA